MARKCIAPRCWRRLCVCRGRRIGRGEEGSQTEVCATSVTKRPRKLAGRPAGMAGEQAADEADVVTDDNPKAQTENAGAEDEAAIEPRETMAGKGKRQCQDRKSVV